MFALWIGGEIKAKRTDKQQGIERFGVVDGLLGDEGKHYEQDASKNKDVLFAAGEFHFVVISIDQFPSAKTEIMKVVLSSMAVPE